MAAFLSSRILRIYPGFIIASLVCALAIGPVYSQLDYFHKFEWSNFLLGLVRLQLTGVPGVFPNTPYPALNGSMWTIPHEMKCYVLVLIAGMTGILNRRHVWLSLFLVSTIAYIVDRAELADVPLDRYFRLIMAFSAGGCFYLYQNSIPWRNELAWVGLILFALFMFSKPLAEPALCIFWGYTILYYAKAGTSALSFNQLPDVSYGVYLYAWPINKILLWHFPTMNIYAVMLSVFALSVLAGTASWFFVESPFMKLKKHFRKRTLQRGDVGNEMQERGSLASKNV